MAGGGENGHTSQPGKHQEPSRRQATMDLEMLGVVSLHDEVIVLFSDVSDVFSDQPAKSLLWGGGLVGVSISPPPV